MFYYRYWEGHTHIPFFVWSTAIDPQAAPLNTGLQRETPLLLPLLDWRANCLGWPRAAPLKTPHLLDHVFFSSRADRKIDMSKRVNYLYCLHHVNAAQKQVLKCPPPWMVQCESAGGWRAYHMLCPLFFHTKVKSWLSCHSTAILVHRYRVGSESLWPFLNVWSAKVSRSQMLCPKVTTQKDTFYIFPFQMSFAA
jgi:hypothetical protein